MALCLKAQTSEAQRMTRKSLPLAPSCRRGRRQPSKGPGQPRMPHIAARDEKRHFFVSTLTLSALQLLPATAKTYFFVHSGIRSADLAFSASDRVRSPQVTAGNDRPCAVLERRVDLSF
eukprot:scaffold62012_cov40-Phaeocystis_antarctica.AAC.1